MLSPCDRDDIVIRCDLKPVQEVNRVFSSRLCSNSSMNRNLDLIDSAPALAELCSLLQRCSWLAVDTEFERVNTYYPELCLVQVSGMGINAVIDPLNIFDLEPLNVLLFDPAIIKVFHAARQDLELFYHLHGRLPMPVIDTQLAATLRGYSDQIGYANLVREMLGVDLPKTQTRTNWKRRPLSRKQLEYAADDVIYLGQLYEKLMIELEEHKQLPLLEEQCLALNNPRLYEPDPAMMWKKIKIREVKNFSGASLAVFRQLAAWREITARNENRPRKWIIKDHAIVNIARELPEDREALSGLEGMDAKILNKYGDVLLKMVNAGREAFR